MNKQTKTIIIHTLAFILFGAILGVLSKFLDGTATNDLPSIMQAYDIRNLLGRLSIRVFIAIIISVYSKSPQRSALYVFVFFLSMVSTYYLYSNYVLGFFPQLYAMIWFSCTAISPILAYICRYAKEKSTRGIIITSTIIGVMINLTFYYGMFYIDIKSIFELIFFCATIIILRNGKKEMILSLLLAIIIAIIIYEISPIQF